MYVKRPTETYLARVKSVNVGGIDLQWHTTDEIDLNYTHQVVKVFTVHGKQDWALIDLAMDDMLINSPIPTLFTIYYLWRAADLRQLASAHGIHVPSREPAPDMIERLDAHACKRECPATVVAFRTLARVRSKNKVEQSMKSIRRLNLIGTHSYMQVADEALRRSIIQEWQDTISTSNFEMKSCAPCGRRTLKRDAKQVNVNAINLSLLVNDNLPVKVRPTTYNFELYEHALLHPKGMTSRWTRSDLILCGVCYNDLIAKGRMPKLCLANWLYYGTDELPQSAKEAFKNATPTERVLIARARASRISYRFSELKAKAGDELTGDADSFQQPGPARVQSAASQKCLRGNVLVMPQNSTHLNLFLPPPPEVIRDTVCVVYVGRKKPSKNTIGSLGPTLVRKTRIRTMIEFLIKHNSHYACDSTFHGFSEENLRRLFGPADQDQNEAVPCAIDVGFVQESEIMRAAEADYTTRNSYMYTAGDQGELLMDNVGYTMGDDSPVSYRDMKMKALSHCINGGRFIRSHSGDKFMPDFENPSLLTWLFPHLDPWGIGGFHEQSRLISISMEEQLKYLLELDNSPFQRDPDFAFVYFNILQKKSVCDSVRFRVAAARQKAIVQQLLSIDKHQLDQLIARMKADKAYKPQTQEENRILGLVNSIGASLHDIPGTAGYKLKMRNEIRSLVSFQGTPAFFITLNPSDIHHPLVRLLSGNDINLEHAEQGEQLTEWQRRLTVANNPSSCAKFFHSIISAFISVVLRYGRKDRGLLGKCTAYYGTVEAQARGTLHCHMLIWLYGHPNPQKMRDLMSNSSQYQQDMFMWLESLIKCELLGTTRVVVESSGVELPRPTFSERDDYVHPSSHLGPRIKDIPETSFPWHFASSVKIGRAHV